MLAEVRTARDRMIVTWLADSGLRVGELCGVWFCDLHLRTDHPYGESNGPHVQIVRRRNTNGVAFIGAFAGLDGTLLLTAGGIVIVILLLVYRSPVLWFFPPFSAALVLGLSSMVNYFLAKNDVLTLNGQSPGILSVLVLGAGTDDALLLIARYREELHIYRRYSDAMIKAWKESASAIFASGTTVIIGVLCLGFSELNSNKSLGPVAAIGIACTLLVMMTFLPVALALAGRWVFWPRRPTTAVPGSPLRHCCCSACSACRR